MNTPTSTPETDALDLELFNKIQVKHASGEPLSEITKYVTSKMIELSRKLERERDAAREQLDTTKDHLDSTNTACNKAESERDQLRKVCDELSKALMRQIPISDQLGERKWNAINDYNSLPHVIAKKGNNAK